MQHLKYLISMNTCSKFSLSVSFANHKVVIENDLEYPYGYY